MALKIGIILLLLILVLLTFLLSSTSEGFQAYDRAANLEDLRYLMGLGLRPEYNNSYRDQLKLYADNNNGADFRTSADAVGYRTRPPPQPSTPNATPQAASGGTPDPALLNGINTVNQKLTTLDSKLDTVNTQGQSIFQTIANIPTIIQNQFAQLLSPASNTRIQAQSSDIFKQPEPQLSNIFIAPQDQSGNIFNRLQDQSGNIFNRLQDQSGNIFNTLQDQSGNIFNTPQVQSSNVVNTGEVGFTPLQQRLYDGLRSGDSQLFTELRRRLDDESLRQRFLTEFNRFTQENPNPTETEFASFVIRWINSNGVPPPPPPSGPFGPPPPQLTPLQDNLIQQLQQTNPQLSEELTSIFRGAIALYFIEDLNAFTLANTNPTASQFETFVREWLATDIARRPTESQLAVIGELFSANPEIVQQVQQVGPTNRAFATALGNFLRTNPNFTANQLRTFLTNLFAANPSASSQASTNNPPPPPTGPTPSQRAVTDEVRQTNPELFAQLTSLSSRVPNSDQLWATALQTYSVENPNFTASQFQTFLTNWLAANTPPPPPPPPNSEQQTEQFTNRRKNVYQDFSSRFSLMPTEYAPAL
jgi:hypothetical protein